jgi:hypothetical protein
VPGSDSLRAGPSGDRIPVAAGFAANVPTGPGAHLASGTMGNGSFFQGVKRPGRGFDQVPPSSIEAEERVEVNFHSTSDLYGLLFYGVRYIFSLLLHKYYNCNAREYLLYWTNELVRRP